MSDVLRLKTTDVTDGDTLTCVGSAGGEITVRVWGIDAPESGQPYGPPATRAARELVAGDFVDVHVQDTGPYGRHIGRVLTQYQGRRVDLARSLVLSGLAWHARDYPTSETLVQHEQTARAEEKGLWCQPDPTPPWEFRDTSDSSVDLVAAGRRGWRWGRWIMDLLT